jgi:hypothetical protein
MTIDEITLKIKTAVLSATPFMMTTERNGKYALSDILLLLQKKEDGRFYNVKEEGLDLAKCDYDDRKKVYWDLKKDNLDDQSDAVKLYIYEFIK